MLSDEDLVKRLREYYFSKLDDKSRVKRVHGFGAMRSSMSSLSSAIVMDDLPPIKVKEYRGKIYEAYGFMAACYATIDFEELEEDKMEPAVYFLFKTNTLVSALGKYVEDFNSGCIQSIYKKRKIDENIKGYRALQSTIQEMEELDEGNFYRERIKKLEAQLPKAF